MKKFVLGFIGFLFIAFFLWKFQFSIHSTGSGQVFNVQSNSKYQMFQIGTQKLRVEVAKTPEELSKGLGGRDTLGSDGMLFLLPVRIIPTFWMKGMRFGLDFVWINEGKVVALTPNIPFEPGVSDAALKTYSPGLPTDTVLELLQGDIAKRGIKVGDTVY